MIPASLQALDRRAFLRAGILAPTALLVAACGSRGLGRGGRAAGVSAQELELTPPCGDEAEPTVEQTEGPYFKASSPERPSLLAPGMAGTRLVVAGSVLSRRCEPIPGALLDFWQADDGGVYDNTGYRLRGHQYSGADGRFWLETVMPGLYPGRTRHIHVKVQAANGPILTTQLYFPDEPQNRRDGIFNSALVMGLSDAEDGKRGAFDFVVKSA